MAKRRKKKKKKKIVKKRRKVKSLKKISKRKLTKQSKDSDGNTVFKVPDNWSKQAYVNRSQYEK